MSDSDGLPPSAGWNTRLIACVGDNGGPLPMCAYAEAYFRAGDTLIDAIRRGEQILDLAVYPAAYCYRHGVELALKRLAQLIGCLEDSAASQRRPDHSLAAVWGTVRSGLTESEPEMPQDVLVVVDRVITHLNKVDPSGVSFRYPRRVDGTPTLTAVRDLDLDALQADMRDARELFDGLISSLEQWCEGKAELQYEAQFVDAEPYDC